MIPSARTKLSEAARGLAPADVAERCLIHALEVLESRGEKRDFGLPEARVLAAHGGDRRSEAARQDQGGNNHLENREKNTVEHIKARLRRDDPELAARVEAGELTANAAAVAKGWRKKPTRLDKLRAAWRRTSPEDRRTFLSEVLARQEEAA